MRRIALLAVLLIATSEALAQGTYTQIDVPGAVWTECFGIDTAGDIVGAWLDSNSNWNGFLLSAGVYTTIDYPGASRTFLYGINDSGQIVGINDLQDVGGFIYNIQTQTFTTVNYPLQMAASRLPSTMRAQSLVRFSMAAPILDLPSLGPPISEFHHRALLTVRRTGLAAPAKLLAIFPAIQGVSRISGLLMGNTRA